MWGLALVAAGAWSQLHAAPQHERCLQDAQGVTYDMLECLQRALVFEDARLNAGYRKLLDQLSPARRQQLRATQRLWVSYRDANCGFYADPQAGTSAQLAAQECLLTHTRARADELARWLQP